MKTKLYLTLLAIDGLIFSINSAAIATESHSNSRSNISHLSQTIAKLIDVEDRTNLVELAVDRALIAQQVNQPQIIPPVTAGVPRLDVIQTDKDTTQTDSKTPQTDNKTTQDENKIKPTIRGRVAKPQLKFPPIGRYLKDLPNAQTDRQNPNSSTSN